MKDDKPVDLVIYILDNEAIVQVNSSISAQIFVDLLELPESLSNVDANLSEDVWMLLKSLALELDQLVALIVEVHFEDTGLPISTH